MKPIRFVYSLLLATILIAAASDAFAQSRYAVSVLRSCIQNNTGFDANLVNLGSNNTRTQEAIGTLVLNANGTGSLVTTNTTLRTDSGPQATGQQAANFSTSRCAVRHTTLANGDIRLTLRNCTYETTVGRSTGDFGTIEGTIIRARPTPNGELLQLTNFVQNSVETVNYNLPTPGTAYRICQRVGTAVLKP